ncbi:protein ROLLING AND ERECT LEAF 2-like [Argentina anserina]|uniref:protein ROLLING AND ERECT LEAF 2-like n=1 Tax=Argentina anserina TaxID=57926 RepID=UPI0021762A9A|nr:protein ROLLING AND ERECT LEAF 2-like [Potentilla anserina]XP_050372367.1 protein ROLLING AND ERECT LEAF 2-like [Potentilla anserina]XP_050372368.1 protein ROLLING AND ERECT LEAF 2-like [Potentilla anserina]
MGCSTSKLDDEEAVQLCKDRKRFIKQALEQRTRFASGHLAYIQSLKRVSAALRDYIEVDEPHEFSLESFITPPFTPIKNTSPGFICDSTPKIRRISSKSYSPAQIPSGPHSSVKVHYLRSGGNPAVSVEERPPRSPEMVRVEAYSPIHQYGMDGFFAMQSSPMISSSFFSYSPNNRPSIPPPSPQHSQWDFFWNPFSSLDYGYPTRTSMDQTVMDDEIRGLRQVREEEGIPDLEEIETEQEDCCDERNITQERAKVDLNYNREEVIVEDVDEDEDEDEEMVSGNENEHEAETSSHGHISIEVRAQTARQVETSNQGRAVVDQEAKEETPGFTAYVNRRPTSMAEVIKDLEAQFVIVCNAANQVSALLEASREQCPSSSNELSAMKMLNPVALFRSASSSRSASSRCLVTSSCSNDDGYESSSDFSEEPCMLSGSHQTTLDRLYAWEKKLYEEVKSGEKVRMTYEKKLMQLRNQDVKGDDQSAIEKTRVSIRDLHTQMKVSIHSVEAISKRIETLRDEELQPQLSELVQGLARMWKVMVECHQTQKQSLNEAKILLAGTPSKLEAKRLSSSTSATDPNRLACSAANLETELRNWRVNFQSWITSQRSYVHALTGWLLRCMRADPDTSKLSFSPRRSNGALPIFEICIPWSTFLDALHEMPVLDGLDFFAAGMGSLYAQQVKEDLRRAQIGSKRFESTEELSGNMELVEVGQVEQVMTADKMAEVAIRVLCAGMSVTMSSLTQFSIASAGGYADLLNQCKG